MTNLQLLYQQSVLHAREPATLYYLFGFILWVLLSVGLITLLKSKFHIGTNYTRKIFHIIVFTSAWFIQTFMGFFYLLIYALVAVIVIGLATVLGRRSVFFKSLSRESAVKRSKITVILPLVSTALGGVINNIWFITYAPIGYLITGWGDAMGELVGANYGRYEFSNPFNKQQRRTVEGSLAVFITSAIACLVGLFVIDKVNDFKGVWISLVTALAVMLVEALSPSEIDNLTIQCTVAIALTLMIGL